MQMFRQIRELFFTRTGKDTTVVFIGTLINVLTGAVFFILVPRILGPTNYGLFSTVIATGLMAVTIANFGIDTGILRFAKGDKLNTIFTLALKSYLVGGFLVSVFGLLFSDLIANFLNSPNISGLLKIAFISTIFLLLTNFFVAALQARGEFAKASMVNISSNIVRLILLIVGAYFFTINLHLITLIFFFVTIVSTVAGKFFLPLKFEKIQKSEILDFFKYNFWIAASLIIASIPFDNYFLLKLAGPYQTGLYAAPFKILTAIYQFGGGFTRVLAPRFASFDSDQKAKNFALKTSFFPLIFSAGLIVFVAVSKPLITLLLGESFTPSYQILMLLSIGFIFFFASTIPSSIILYYFGNSKVAFAITAARFLLFVILLAILIPQVKAQGAAIAFTTTEIISFFAMTGYVFLKFSK